VGEVLRHLNSLGLSWGRNPAWRFGPLGRLGYVPIEIEPESVPENYT
jgi:hypothetical protein